MSKKNLIILIIAAILIIIILIIIFYPRQQSLITPSSPASGSLPQTQTSTYAATNTSGINTSTSSSASTQNPQRSAGTAQNSSSISSGEALASSISKLIQLTTQPVIGPVYDPASQSIKYYLQQNGWAISSSPDGTNVYTLSNTNIPGITNVVWSPSTERVILYLDNGSKELYDYSTHQPLPIQNGITAAAFSPDNNQIVFYDNTNPSTPALDILDLTSLNQNQISSNTYIDPTLSWKGSNIFLSSTVPNIYRRPKDLDLYATQSSKMYNILNMTYGFQGIESPDGSKILYSKTSIYGENLDLYVHSLTGGETNLGLATIPEKCAFASNVVVYCAVPDSWPAYSQFPEDYDTNLIQTTDSFWAINIVTGQKQEILKSSDLQDKIDADNLLLAGNYLVFINKYNNCLYSLLLQ